MRWAGFWLLPVGALIAGLLFAKHPDPPRAKAPVAHVQASHGG